MTTLQTPLARAVPERVAKALASHRDLHTVADLLWFLPRRYLERHSDLQHLEEGAYVVFVGTVAGAETRRMKNRPGTMLTATVTSGAHRLDLTFFRSYGHDRKLVPGHTGLFAGRVSLYRGQWQLAHPVYEMFGAAAEGDIGGVLDRDLIPVYREVKGVPSWTLTRSLEVVFPGLHDDADGVPPELAARRDLPSFLEAMELVHLPRSRADVARGMRRLKYDEALTIQTVLALRRAAQAGAPAVPREPVEGGLLAAFDERLPFDLTEGQRRVGAEIAADLARPHPMHRLLQGEVGSGKTVVALRAMLAVVDAGGQAALLAPTEVLAAQHHRSMVAMLGDLAEGGMLGGAAQGTRVALLTGSLNAAARKAALLDAASGSAGIVVGTHALIQDKVQLADLGLVVVDEQHRFGVEQRDALRGKATHPPHVLVMTATPIPRTVAMTVFGDMETSTLDELPRGRSPIASHVVDNQRWYERAWERVAEEIAAGHQAYVVCPRIGEDDAADLTAVDYSTGGPDDTEAPPPEKRPLRGVVEVLEELRATPALAGLRIEMLHGAMAPEVKDAVMADVVRGDIDVLVATTVIEVGVDVPNATAMVVLDADRFGVSQLHQLRGRVGRGSAPGLCLFVTQEPTPSAIERLRAVAATTDGFELSRLDLELRREGDVLGARQSGAMSQLRVLTLRSDGDLIADARDDATALVAADPHLREHPALKAAVESALDDEQAAFLERG